MPTEPTETPRPKNDLNLSVPQRAVLLWLLLFLISLGLGYPPLNRYDPAKVDGTSDVREYRNIVLGHFPEAASAAASAGERLARSENYYRVLVPLIARPFYRLVRGHVGTWDPALLGLLISNAIFTAATGCIIVAIARHLNYGPATALVAALLYLVNFCVPNLNLVGLVDSAEGCFMAAIVWSLLTGRWYLLPLWGIGGALAKETFAPLSGVFVLAWWIAEIKAQPRDRVRRFLWMGALGVSSLATVTVTMSVVAGALVWPWQFAAFAHQGGNPIGGLWGCFADHTFWFVFGWLLPLGLLRLRCMPRPWVVASAAAFGAALLMGAYNDARGNTARALYNVAGPILNLSAAAFIVGIAGSSVARRDIASSNTISH